MRILVAGRDGQIARALAEAAAGRPDLSLVCVGRPEFDLTVPATIAPAVEAFGPDLVVNAAAYTAVDRAESEPDAAFSINRDGAEAIAAAAAGAGAPLVHLSTDYVFDGTLDRPYREDDAVGPINTYGRSKLEGEQAVAAAAPRHLILRLSWVYAPYGHNFVRTMLRLSATRERLTVVDDQTGCPSHAPDIAGAILAIADRIGSGWRDDFAGVTHLSGPDAVTWCGFARAIIDGAAARGHRRVPVMPIATEDYPTPAARPRRSVLSCARASALFGVALPPLAVSLDACLDRLVGPELKEHP